ncbi:Holliday junction resolvase RuvX [Marinilabiliaceae bacterium JC040]|nr:Holliday junction resolvase RuvX [Marinilabiliaceae bacterium JC040]
MARVLAIDYGRKKVGLAVTDPLQIIANGLETVPTHTLLDYLKKYIQKEEVETIVVGHPKQMNNTDSESMTYIKPFLKKLKKLFPDMNIEMMDERFTSKIAFQTMIDGGLKKKARQNKELVDTISATIILQSWMEKQKFSLR